MFFGLKFFDGVGFPTPSSIPVDCAYRTAKLPSNAAWLGTLMGLMEVLTDENNWQQLEGGITREQAAAVWADIVQGMYDYAEGHGPVFDVRQNPTNLCSLEKTFDGETWEEFADLRLCRPTYRNGLQGLEVDDGFGFFRVPDGEWIDDSPTTYFTDLVPTGPMLTQTNDECVAAANATNVIYQTFLSVGQNLVSQVTSEGIKGVEIESGLALLFGTVLASYASLAIAAFLSALQAVYAVTPFDAASFRALACLIQDNMTGSAGNWTLNYGAIYAGMGAAGVNASLIGAIQLILDLIGSNGLNLAAKTTAITDYNCGAITFYTKEFAPSVTLYENAAGVRNQVFTGALTQRWAFTRMKLDTRAATGGGIGSDGMPATTAGYVDLGKPITAALLNQANPDYWWYNSVLFTTAALATAAIRIALNNPTYNPAYLGTYGNIVAGQRLEMKSNTAAPTVAGWTTFHYEVYTVLSYAACP